MKHLLGVVWLYNSAPQFPSQPSLEWSRDTSLHRDTIDPKFSQVQRSWIWIWRFYLQTADTETTIPAKLCVSVRSTTFKRSLFITGSLLHEYHFSFCPQEFGIQSVWHSLFRCLSLQMTRYNRQRVLSLQASLVQYAESRLKNGRDTYAILAKLMNDLKKSY